MSGFETILTLFLLIGVGYLAKRTILAEHSLAALNSFVFYIAVPALLFLSAYRLPLDSLLQPAYIGAFLLATVITGLLAVLGARWWFPTRSPEQHVMRAVNGTFANFAYMGIPLISALLGERAYGPMICIILVGNLFIIGGAQVLIESMRQQGSGFQALIRTLDRSLLRSPVFLATVAGVGASLLQLPLPAVVSNALEIMAPSAIPVALFCLGAGLQFAALKNCKLEMVWLITVKLVFQPLITLGIFTGFGLTDPNWLLATVLLTALPTGALAHVVALRYDVSEQETSLCVVLSTLLSALTVAVWSGWLL
ncbi:AEC family transporter [Pontibacter sp. JAM-7]|uniref:AEC family transporter n=1 Tax=Pontibacter sp. JAM-7 TaxID=3366581 RepID=UPI003AF6F312